MVPMRKSMLMHANRRAALDPVHQLLHQATTHRRRDRSQIDRTRVLVAEIEQPEQSIVVPSRVVVAHEDLERLWTLIDGASQRINPRRRH
jgi:hypothetical protein